MTENETLLQNEEGSIVTDGPLVLVCDCPGGLVDVLVRLYAPVALVASILISAIVGLRAAPFPILFIAILWTGGSAVGNAFGKRSLRKHGKIRVDLEREQIVQEGRGFSRTFALQNIKRISTPVVAGLESGEGEPGFEPRWLLVEIEGGAELRLGKGPSHQLRPALSWMRKNGLAG
jgi:hypothetical protein